MKLHSDGIIEKLYSIHETEFSSRTTDRFLVTEGPINSKT